MASLAFTYFLAASTSTIYQGSAANRTFTSPNADSSVTVLGYVGNNTGTFEIYHIPSGSTSSVVSVDFANGDAERDAYFSINGGSAFLAQFTSQIQSFDVVQTGALFYVPGFTASTNNSITVSNPTVDDWTPDFYRFGFAKAPDFTDHLVADPSSDLEGGAQRRQVGSMNIVGNLGYDGTVQMNGISASSPTSILSIDYSNPDDGARTAYISVNGGDPVPFQFPRSGASPSDYRSRWLVTLSGFTVGPSNTIKFSNPSNWGPDLYQVGIPNAPPSSTTTTETSTLTGPSGKESNSPSPSPSQSPSHGKNTGAIAGGVVGGVIGAGLIALFVFFFFMRRKKGGRGGAEIEIEGEGEGSSTELMSSAFPSSSSAAQLQTFTGKLYNPNDPSTFPPSLNEEVHGQGAFPSPNWENTPTGRRPVPEL